MKAAKRMKAKVRQVKARKAPKVVYEVVGNYCATVIATVDASSAEEAMELAENLPHSAWEHFNEHPDYPVNVEEAEVKDF